jgi:uncharacterized protein YkwD
MREDTTMKKNFVVRTVLTLGFTAIMLLSVTTAAMANETDATPAETPASLLGNDGAEQISAEEGLTTIKEEDIKIAAIAGMTKVQTVEYMLSSEYADALRAEFYALINEYRAENGLRKLEINLELQDYADIRADELRVKFSHTRPDGTPAGSGWHDSRNVMNSRYAENATSTGAIGTDPKSTALGIFKGWKKSSGHNKHMLYEFESNITMAFGICPKFEDGFVTSGAIFASGY